MRPYDVITFDCYGTLIDWETGIGTAFLRAAATDGVTLKRSDVLGAYAGTERVVERERYRSYRDVLEETAFRVANSLGWPLAYERAGFLGDSLPSWTPFPDTNPALERLKAAGYKLGILSNIDDDFIAATQKHFTVAFDFVITAQRVHSYKPAHGHWIAARPLIGYARWLHAAESNYHDIVPTNVLGIPNAWINRTGAPQLEGGAPRHAFRDMASFADAMSS